MLSRLDAEALDRDDPLASWRERFVDPGVIYLDGNSLGMAPKASLTRLAAVAAEEWAVALIGSWHHWLDLPRRVGDRLAPVIGAEPGTVVVHDSTTLNLYQAVHAALALHAPARSGRSPVLAVDAAEFPTDRYVVERIAADLGAGLRWSASDIDGVDVVVRSLVDFRTAAVADLVGETARARAGGTVVVWDLSHAAGAIEVDVTSAGVDLAVGCSYKYLNGGPGAPAWTYARRSLHPALDQPIAGWFAQSNQFAMDAGFDPVADMRRFLLGTPGILALSCAEVGISMAADAGMPAIATKGRELTAFALGLADQFGLQSPTPRDPRRRGSHVAIRTGGKDLDEVHGALTDAGVIVDQRPPDLLRVGCSALTTRFTDVYDGMSAIAVLVN